MGLFKRKDPRAAALAAGYSVLDAQVTVRGDMETDGMLRIDGRLEGNVLRAGHLVVGAGAAIVGRVSARDLVVGGTIEGNITAEVRVEVEASAVVVGDIEADAILVHEGAEIRGRMLVRPRHEQGTEARKERSAGPVTAPLQLADARTA
jgi:cytoskeletal protein CcmA (bactofilin family)